MHTQHRLSSQCMTGGHCIHVHCLAAAKELGSFRQRMQLMQSGAQGWSPLGVSVLAAMCVTIDGVREVLYLPQGDYALAEAAQLRHVPLGSKAKEQGRDWRDTIQYLHAHCAAVISACPPCRQHFHQFDCSNQHAVAA